MLASGSPRRKQLLTELGFEFEVKVKEVDESIPAGTAPAAAAEMIARRKAEAFSEESSDHLVITADTVVAVDDKILGKPKDADDAAAMLRLLSGRSHEVITGVALCHSNTVKVFHEVTKVFFRDLSESDIEFYIDHDQPFDKAGSYGIQDWIGKAAITKIEGDYYNVVGLPTSRLLAELMAFLA